MVAPNLEKLQGGEEVHQGGGVLRGEEEVLRGKGEEGKLQEEGLGLCCCMVAYLMPARIFFSISNPYRGSNKFRCSEMDVRDGDCAEHKVGSLRAMIPRPEEVTLFAPFFADFCRLPRFTQKIQLPFLCYYDLEGLLCTNR